MFDDLGGGSVELALPGTPLSTRLLVLFSGTGFFLGLFWFAGGRGGRLRILGLGTGDGEVTAAVGFCGFANHDQTFSNGAWSWRIAAIGS